MPASLSSDNPSYPLNRARVPEHSVAFMRAMSGGEAFFERGYLFLHAEDWLMGVGYPFLGEEDEEPEAIASPEECRRAFDEALGRAVERTGALSCYVIAPELPERLEPFADTRDRLYTLPAANAVPGPLQRPVALAASRLTVSEDRLFTAAHRMLWAEFLARADMRPQVRELYARTEAVLAASRACFHGAGVDVPGGPAVPEGSASLDVRLLNAWDAEGNLAASLLLDYSPKDFLSYIIGAHSRKNYTPHATDLLFAAMLERARNQGKRYIHLGLGVNQGIARFKKKWGGRPVLPYAMASWREDSRSAARRPSGARTQNGIDLALRALLSAPPDLSKQQVFDTFPQQRSFAMIYTVRKGKALSYLCGSAHFFRYSFAFAFRDLFAPLHTVIFEGPLDEDFLAAVEQSGRNPEPGSTRVIDALDEPDIRRLERVIHGPEGPFARLFGFVRPRGVDVRGLLADARPWFAFFSLWVAYLEGRGWHQSVDLEAWRTAKDMGKAVIAMENLEEQLASLESVPIPRIADFLRRCGSWPSYARRNIRTYLDGDLRRMMGTSVEFPSRTERVINYRDERFRNRMRPFLEEGDCAVFVGTAHLVGLIPMLEEDGFSVRRFYPTAGLKLRAAMQRIRSGVLPR